MMIRSFPSRIRKMRLIAQGRAFLAAWRRVEGTVDLPLVFFPACLSLKECPRGARSLYSH
jgi:hypothetical protein